MINIVLGLVILALLLFNAFLIYKFVSREDRRFQEFVKAVKAKDAAEYAHMIPEDEEAPLPMGDELVNVEDIGTEELLRAAKKTNED